MTKLYLCILCFMLLIPIASGQQKGPLQGKLEVFKVVKVEKDKYERVPVKETKPGDILEYVVKYHNYSNKLVTNVQLVGPIPRETFLLAGTVKTKLAKNMMASIDGGMTYVVPPIKKKIKQGNKIVEIVVPENEWTHLKFEVPQISPGDFAGCRYWVTVR